MNRSKFFLLLLFSFGFASLKVTQVVLARATDTASMDETGINIPQIPVTGQEFPVLQEPLPPTLTPTPESLPAALIQSRVFIPLIIRNQAAASPSPTPTQGRQSLPTPTRTPVPSVQPPVSCTFTIAAAASTVDGRVAPYNQIRPGDTICLAAGVRGPLQFRNFSGTADRPIHIVNQGGRVIVNTTSGWYGFRFSNVQHFRLTGTGSSDEYGIFVQKAVTFGIYIAYKTEHFEMDHLEFTEVVGTSIAIHAKTDASCPTPNGRNDDDYDYNGDGLYDAQDAVSRSNFTQHNFVFHDNYFHGFRRGDNSVSIAMAYYIGNSNYSDAVYTRTCINPDGTAVNGVAVVNPVIDGVQIYNDVINYLGDKTVQVGSAVKSCDLSNITISQAAQVATNDIMGININPGSVCNIHNNRITNSRGYGISYFGDGGRIYNNIIANVGLPGTYYTAGIYVGKRPAGYHHYQNTYVFNNTIVNPAGYGIVFSDGEGTDDRIQNNIIVNPGAGYSYISIPGGHFTLSNNYQTANIADVRFVDSANGNYTLLPNSPAVNTGADLSPFGIFDDFFGTSRPQGGAFDVGAAEYR